MPELTVALRPHLLAQDLERSRTAFHVPPVRGRFVVGFTIGQGSDFGALGQHERWLRNRGRQNDDTMA